ncbi:MAG: ATP-binding protein [Bradyrhizobium sp.]|nr:ATP-binding protein [Bradyrhizobium sp.]
MSAGIQITVRDGYEYALLPPEDLATAAGVPPRYAGLQWRHWDWSRLGAAPEPRGALKWLSTWSRDDAAWSVVLSGGVGTGKTMALTCTCRRGVRALGPSACRFVPWIDFCRDVTASWRDGGEREIVRSLTMPAFVAIDDLGVGISRGEQAQAWQRELAYRVIDGRYRRRQPTMISTNLRPSELGAAIDARVVSRLTEDGRWIDMSTLSDARMDSVTPF